MEEKSQLINAECGKVSFFPEVGWFCYCFLFLSRGIFVVCTIRATQEMIKNDSRVCSINVYYTV